MKSERQDQTVNSYINPAYTDETSSQIGIVSRCEKSINNNEETIEEDENENTSEQRPLIGTNPKPLNPSLNPTQANQPLTSQHYYYRRNPSIKIYILFFCVVVQQQQIKVTFTTRDLTLYIKNTN